jgi:hypothetical protein
VSQNARYILVTITPTEVGRIAADVKASTENFDPVGWLEQNCENIATLAMAAVKDIVIEGLEIGLADHPLVLRSQLTAGSKEPPLILVQ